MKLYQSNPTTRYLRARRRSGVSPSPVSMSQQDGGPDDGFTLVTSSTRRRRVNIETKHVKPNSHAGGRGNIGKGNGKARTNSAQQALVQDGQAASVDVAPTEADIDKMRKSVLAHRHILRQGKLGEMIRACFEQLTAVLYRRADVKGKGKAASDAKNDAKTTATTSAASDAENDAKATATTSAASQADALPRTIYALGMGTVSSNRTAQIQLAFLLELHDHLQTQIQRSTGHSSATTATQETHDKEQATAITSTAIEVQAYDPLSNRADTALLTVFGIRTSPKLTANDIGPLTKPTLFYMPHCPRPLYESYLAASFTAMHLPNVILCANRLSRYAEFLPADRLSREMPAVWRILPYLNTVEVPNDPDGSLSDLAFQIFNEGEGSVESSRPSHQGRTERGTFQPARISKKHKKKQASGAVPEPPRPTPQDDDFWTLPPREASDADAEVL